MALALYTFEGQTPGTAVTVANSDDFGSPAVYFASAAGVTYTAQSSHGAGGLQFAGATGVTAVVQVNPADNLAQAPSVYYKVTDYPPAATKILQPRNSAGSMGGVTLGVDGRLRCENQPGSTIFTAVEPVPLNQWFRVDYSCKAATATTGETHFEWYSDDTQPAVDSFNAVNVNHGTTVCTLVSIGKITASTWTTPFFADTIRTNDGTVVLAGSYGISIAASDIDPVGVTDTLVVDKGKSITINDDIGMTEGQQAVDIVHSLPEALGISDTVALIISRLLTISDPIGVLDAAATATARTVTVVDAVGTVDAVPAIKNVTGSATDQDDVSLVDTAITEIARVITITDLVGVLDAASVAKPMDVEIVDGIGITEVDSPGIGWSLTVVDIIDATDSPGAVINEDGLIISVSIVDDLVMVDDTSTSSDQAAHYVVVTENIGIDDTLMVTKESETSPVDTLTRTKVTFGPYVDGRGIPLRGEAVFLPTSPILQTATGSPVVDTSITVKLVAGQGSVDLVNVDQAGVTDGNHNAITNWGYRSVVRFTDAPEKNPKPFTFQVFETDPAELDLDKLAATIRPTTPVAISPRPVTSVNGLTGDVTVTGGTGSGATFHENPVYPGLFVLDA